MIKRAFSAAVAASFLVAALSSSAAYAQFPQIRIPGIPTQEQQQAQQNATEDGDKSMGQMLQAREERLARQRRNSTIIGTIIGFAGAAACGAFRSDVSSERQALCAAAGALLGYGGYLLSNRIQQSLNASQQRQLLVAASDSLRTGEPAALEFPDSTATATVTPQGTPTTRDANVDIFYDSARVASPLQPITVIAQPVSWNRRLDIRDTPAATGRSTGAIPANSVFYISGQTPANENWYMVSQRVQDGDVTAFMVVGYVNMSEVRPAAEEQLTVQQIPETLAEGQVQATLRCQEMAYQVRDERGRTIDDTSSQCLGPEGTLLSA